MFSGDPSLYHEMLTGKKIISSNPGTGYTCGGNVEIVCDDMLLVINTPIKYHPVGKKLPAKHQLLIEFVDGSHMSCTVQMWGAMLCYPLNEDSLTDNNISKKCPDPLTEAFDKEYFDKLWDNTKQTLSVKAFLATEQRIPSMW